MFIDKIFGEGFLLFLTDYLARIYAIKSVEYGKEHIREKIRCLESFTNILGSIIDNYPDSEFYSSAKDRIEFIKKNFLNYK